MILRGVLLWLCLGLSSSVKVLTWPPLNCSTQGLGCTITTSNCMDKSWLELNKYTPSSPEELQASVKTRRDKAGHLHPVLDANWTLRDDGSINYLKATELHVLVMSTNQNLCVRYSFKGKLPMRSPSGEKWSFSANMVMLEPGKRYRVSVFNIPKPELGHSDYDINKEVKVPDCQDPTMQMTRVCIERGSLWRANISLAKVPAAGGRSALAVSFRPDTLCEEYIVIVSCSDEQHADRVNKGNRTTLNAIFSLDKWPRSCCQFDVQVKPIFPQCGQDCTRQRATLQICDVEPKDPAISGGVPSYTYVILMLMLTCVVTTVISCALCRKPGKNRDAAAPLPGFKPAQHQLEQPPKVLVIYSQDHYLYRDIVLKLCAFLQVKCGAKVLVDLLDSTSVGMVGRLRWLEWQRQQLKNPSDKILTCTRQACRASTWRHTSMTSAANKTYHRFFDITVKYKLMKHFEELYFRILDIEKYQPGQVNHIEGIGGDEYFNCPSGRALKNAIENFQAYQLENPDWFERECVEDEEEVMTDANLLIEQLQIPPVLQCVPLIRDGPPVQIREVEITENCDSIYVLTPELSCQHPGSSVVELTPEVNPEYNHQYPPDLDEVLTDHMHPHRPSPESVYIVKPVLHNPPLPRQNWLSLEEEPLGQVPTEDDEDDSLLQRSQPSAQLDLRSSAQQNSHNSNPSDSSDANMRSDYLPPSEIGHSVPMEMDEDEVLVPSGKGPNSGSDQGYISKIPSQHESPFKDEALAALARLQEELFQQDL
ncbi:unnamed protein product [Pleuronectes platessa]|uniref:SEFIR domain-containing protein n=1 Tax=Pleuronectes platessa TaxID=8262 RepID=A0A9N7VH86_PLEPL|nr:unnamed protein product [Pleuronectes platessa]